MPIDDSVRKFISRLSDEELRSIIKNQPQGYTKEELEFVEQELENRTPHQQSDQTAPHTPEVSTVQPAPMLHRQSTSKLNILFAVIALVAFAVLWVYLHHRNQIHFEYEVERVANDSSVVYLVKIHTEPNVDITIDYQTYKSNDSGFTKMTIPATQLPLSVASIYARISYEGFDSTRVIQINNQPDSFYCAQHPPLSISDTKRKWFTVTLFASPVDTIFIDGKVISRSDSNCYRLIFDVSDVDPDSIPIYRSKLSLTIKRSHNIWQGFVLLDMPFPQMNIDVSKVKYENETMHFVGNVTHDPSKNIRPEVLVDGRPVTVQENGSFETGVELDQLIEDQVHISAKAYGYRTGVLSVSVQQNSASSQLEGDFLKFPDNSGGIFTNKEHLRLRDLRMTINGRFVRKYFGARPGEQMIISFSEFYDDDGVPFIHTAMDLKYVTFEAYVGKKGTLKKGAVSYETRE